ncbi:hypothetical protein [Streptomyces sp. NPDC086182]|uniref:hypothetical protein n=1 Tax=Streptomyces sp. NPDC086182 TaxID=3155058 RepID=UPI0034172CD1
MNITADHIESLFDNGGQLELPNGDTLTRDELAQYIDAVDIDTDDNGRPLDGQWQILADVLGAPDPTNMPELVDVVATTNTLTSAIDAPCAAVLRDHHDAITIEINDTTGEDSTDTTTLVTFGDLGIYPGGIANPALKAEALRWLREHGWETIADPDRILAGYADSKWRVTDALPVRPAATDDLSQVAVAASRIGQAEEARDQAIRKALAAGHSVIAIAEQANLSRARIYQIRDGRR